MSEQELTREQELRDQAKKRLEASETLVGEDVPVGDSRYRTFVAHPNLTNARVLVKEGTTIKVPASANTPMGLTPAVSRDGDIWAHFAGGVLVTDDPIVIKWCENNGDKCRDANDPRARGWLDWKRGQTKTASRDPVLDPSYNIDEVLYPETSAVGTPPAAPEAAPLPSADTHPVESAQIAQGLAEERA